MQPSTLKPPKRVLYKCVERDGTVSTYTQEQLLAELFPTAPRPDSLEALDEYIVEWLVQNEGWEEHEY